MTLQRAWRRRGPVACLLWPLSLVYRLLAALHRAAYAVGLLRRDRVAVPVIVVGNLVAGGAGKTPVVLALLDHLRARGIAAGVVSRGYGREGTGCRAVGADSRAADVGDEPLLIHRASGAPVVVARRRAEAARALLAAHPDVRVIVSDDGLQHHALQRDIEIGVFDERGVGNGWLLPAGPLREPWPRRLDLMLLHGDPPGLDGHRMQRALAHHARRADGAVAALAGLAPPLHAVAGIAQPDVFFRQLREAGLALATTTPLPDHHAYAPDRPPLPGAGSLLCTEKDAVKLWALRPDAWAVPLELRLPDAFWRALDSLLDARLSSPHGSETA